MLELPDLRALGLGGPPPAARGAPLLLDAVQGEPEGYIISGIHLIYYTITRLYMGYTLYTLYIYTYGIISLSLATYMYIYIYYTYIICYVLYMGDIASRDPDRTPPGLIVLCCLYVCFVVLFAYVYLYVFLCFYLFLLGCPLRAIVLGIWWLGSRLFMQAAVRPGLQGHVI